MNRLRLVLCILVCANATSVSAKVASSAAYEAQRARMNKKLRSIGTRPTSSAVRTNTLDMPIINAQESQKKLPTALDPSTLSEEHKKDVSHFMSLLAQAYGTQHAGMIAQTLFTSPEKLRAVITLVQTRRNELTALLQHRSTFKLLLSDPVKLLNTPKPARQPAAFSLLQFMGKAKKMFSVKEWGGIMRQFVGRTLSTLWDKVWHVVSGALVVILGKQNIYELDETGKIKLDTHGQKIPKMTEEYSINQMGQPEARMVPSKWYSIVEDKHSLLGQIAQSGINQATASALRSLDRLLFRPVVHKTLGVPEWKLSHTQYLLYMHEKKFPNESILSPDKLASRIMATKQPGLIFASGLPFNLRKIMATKDPHLKHKALNVAVTEHLWNKYKDIWSEANVDKTTGTNTVQIQPPREPDRHTVGKKSRSFGSEVLDEARKVGKDMLLAKLQDGPLIQYVIYANMAMSIPRHLFSSFGSGKKLETTIDQSKLEYVQILEAITRAIRSGEADSLSNADGTLRDIKITFDNGPKNESYNVQLSVATQQKLLRAQENLIEKYRPFLELSGEPYEVYIKKLLLPRLMLAVLPDQAKEKLGIHTLGDASKKARMIEDYFDISYNVMQSLVNVLAMVKKFEGITTFAGHYVEVADTLDRFLISVFYLLNSLKPLPGMKHSADDWSKRMKGVLHATYGDYIGSSARLKHNKNTWPYSWLYMGGSEVFTVTQSQQIKNALKKAGGNKSILLLANKSDILNYINHSDDTQALPTQIGDLKLTSNGIDERDVERANKIQKFRNNVAKLVELNITNPIDISQLKFLINSNDSYTGDTPEITVDKKIAAQRATNVILASLYALSVHKKDTESAFFTDGAPAKGEKVSDSIKKLEQEITGNLAATLGHVEGAIGTMHMLYMDFGLREIIAAFDEHYIATGEKMTKIPLRTFGKIVAREGMAHAVGLGADKMLHKMMGPVMAQINRLQGNALLGGGAVQGVLMGKLNQFIGDPGGRTGGYQAARSLVRNLFTYGTAALSGDNFMGSVAMKMMPGGAGPQADQMEVMMHAKMAAESGKEMLPIMKKKMKDMGIDPAMVAGMAGLGGDMDGMDDDMMMQMMGGMDGMPGLDGQPARGPAQEEMGMPSKQLQAALQKAEKIAKESGEEAALKYLQEVIPTLSESDKALLRQMGLSEE